MPISVRLDPDTEATLIRLAESRSTSKSEVVREAIELLASLDSRCAYDLVADLIESAEPGPEDLSEDTGQKFRAKLLSKAHAAG